MFRYSTVAVAMLVVAIYCGFGFSAVHADPLTYSVYKKRVLPPSPCFGSACTRPEFKRKPAPLPPSPCRGMSCSNN